MQEEVPELDKNLLTKFCATCFKNLETFLEKDGTLYGYPESLPQV